MRPVGRHRRLIARYKLTWLGATVEAGTMLLARGEIQERQLYALWLRHAAVSEAEWRRIVKMKEPPARPAVVGRRPEQPR